MPLESNPLDDEIFEEMNRDITSINYRQYQEMERAVEVESLRAEITLRRMYGRRLSLSLP